MKLILFLLAGISLIFSVHPVNITSTVVGVKTLPISKLDITEPPKINIIENKSKCKSILKNSQEHINCDVYNDFIPFLISHSLFIIILSSSLILSKVTKATYFNKYVNILNTFQLTLGTIIYCNIYLIWWLSMIVYSFIPNDKTEILFRLGVWISLNMASVLLPITRNSIWIILFKISYNRIIHIHKFMSILCIISIIIKIVAVLVILNLSFLFVPYNSDTGGSPLGGTLSSLSIILI